MTTKIAVLADIHGNYAALNAALAEIDADPEISHIYCIGDMVGVGYETNEVLSTLFGRSDVSYITGNHEEELLTAVNGGEPTGKGVNQAHHKWLAGRLDQQHVSPLQELQKEIKTEIEGIQVLFTHYHLDENQEYVPIDREPSGEKLDEFYAGSPAKLVIFGHHHPVHFFKTPDRMYMNPGSLGCCEEAMARYATVTFDAGEIEVDLKKARYDNTAFLKGYEELDVPDKEFILKEFHGR